MGQGNYGDTINLLVSWCWRDFQTSLLFLRLFFLSLDNQLGKGTIDPKDISAALPSSSSFSWLLCSFLSELLSYIGGWIFSQGDVGGFIKLDETSHLSSCLLSPPNSSEFKQVLQN